MIREYDREFINGADKLCVVKVYADWCVPCKMYTPEFEKISKKYSNKAYFFSLNATGNQAVLEEFGIRGVPNTLFFRDGHFIISRIGFYDEERLDTMVYNFLHEGDK